MREQIDIPNQVTERERTLHRQSWLILFKMPFWSARHCQNVRGIVSDNQTRFPGCWQIGADLVRN